VLSVLLPVSSCKPQKRDTIIFELFSITVIWRTHLISAVSKHIGDLTSLILLIMHIGSYNTDLTIVVLNQGMG
jgi:hypothetical protein